MSSIKLEIGKKYKVNNSAILYVEIQDKLPISGTYYQFYYVGWPKLVAEFYDGPTDPIYYYKSGRVPNSDLMNNLLDITGEYIE